MIGDASFFSFSGYEDYENFLLELPARIGVRALQKPASSLENCCRAATLIAAEVFQIGESVKGRPIYCLRLGAKGKPGALYVSLVHGLEFVGGDMSLAVLRWFTDGKNEKQAGKILDGCSVYFVPVANPDGYSTSLRQRKRFGAAFGRKNARGVDLNRNYSVGFEARGKGLWTGAPFRFMPVYRGPRAFSEPEPRAIKHLVETEPIKTSISFHSFGRMIGYPYCYKEDRCADHDLLRRIALEMRARQKLVKYRVMQEFDFISTSGDMNDWLYEEGGVLPFIMELNRMGLRQDRPGTWLNPFAWSNMDSSVKEIDNNLPAVLYLAEWTAGNTF